MSRLKIEKCAACHSDNVMPVMQIKDHSISGELFTISECKSCGFRFTQDPPSEDDCGVYYQSDDYISHSDTSKGLVFMLYHKVRSIMLGRKAKLLNQLSAAKTLLDIGSGTGYFLDHMSNEGYSVTGVEVDEKARAYSMDRFGVNVITPKELLQGTLKQTFGYITFWHVLEHLYNPDNYIKICHDLLDENGFLIIALPNHNSRDAAFYKTFWAAYDVPRHLWHFNPETLSLFAVRNGFEVAIKKDMPFDPFYNSMLSEKYKTGASSLVKGAFRGLIAFISGRMNIQNASSVIYILKKSLPKNT
ncbi:MAG: class I SAM-dependent methyltransferase [Saprospiraceae bacterium]|nr:class I SAM-dependent methyltransferase [Saprospiraceae bacterium]